MPTKRVKSTTLATASAGTDVATGASMYCWGRIRMVCHVGCFLQNCTHSCSYDPAVRSFAYVPKYVENVMSAQILTMSKGSFICNCS